MERNDVILDLTAQPLPVLKEVALWFAPYIYSGKGQGEAFLLKDIMKEISLRVSPQEFNAFCWDFFA